ncbi:hypothetical protein ACFSC4_30505 [Deinococcus malanensis]|uniref:hypothetical protein n=1 Tax=Deinococcus malanensis TaxID=1706855 RepID=UPI0036317DC8
MVPPEEVRIRRDRETQQLIHEQIARGTPFHSIPGPTCTRPPHHQPQSVRRAALHRRPVRPRPQTATAARRAARHQPDGPQRPGESHRTDPHPDQLGCSSEDDPGYTDAVAEYFNALADTIVSGSENGVYIGPHGTEISVVPINQTASGAPEITKGNQKRVGTP